MRLNKSITEIDIRIGKRIRSGRTEIGMTQMSLAAALGISYQQVQKYEKAEDRVNAGYLKIIARVLNKPAEYFYGELVIEVSDVPNRARFMRLARSWPNLCENDQKLILGLVDSLSGVENHADN